MPKTFLHHFTDGTINEIQDSDDADISNVHHNDDDKGCVGIFAPILCCMKCRSPVNQESDEVKNFAMQSFFPGLFCYDYVLESPKAPLHRPPTPSTENPNPKNPIQDPNTKITIN